jgi:serine/threonine protein kinase
MARILSFLEMRHVAHTDIKPENICIDSDNKLTIIDFGLTTTVNKYSSNFCGTRFFTDPTFLGEKKIISYENDMFAMGLTAYYILTGNCSWSELLDYSIEKWETVNTDEQLFNLLPSVHGDADKELFDVVRSMLSFSKRITPTELYNHPLVKDLKHLYPLPETEGNIPRTQQVVEYVDSDFRRSKDPEVFSNWIIYVLLAVERTHITLYTLDLFSRYWKISGDVWKNETTQLKMLSCVAIASILYGCAVDFEVLSNIINSIGLSEKCKPADITVEILSLLESFNWNIYPEYTYINFMP